MSGHGARRRCVPRVAGRILVEDGLQPVEARDPVAKVAKPLCEPRRSAEAFEQAIGRRIVARPDGGGTQL